MTASNTNNNEKGTSKMQNEITIEEARRRQVAANLDRMREALSSIVELHEQAIGKRIKGGRPTYAREIEGWLTHIDSFIGNWKPRSKGGG